MVSGNRAATSVSTVGRRQSFGPSHLPPGLQDRQGAEDGRLLDVPADP